MEIPTWRLYACRTRRGDYHTRHTRNYLIYLNGLIFVSGQGFRKTGRRSQHFQIPRRFDHYRLKLSSAGQCVFRHLLGMNRMEPGNRWKFGNKFLQVEHFMRRHKQEADGSSQKHGIHLLQPCRRKSLPNKSGLRRGLGFDDGPWTFHQHRLCCTRKPKHSLYTWKLWRSRC